MLPSGTLDRATLKLLDGLARRDGSRPAERNLKIGTVLRKGAKTPLTKHEDNLKQLVAAKTNDNAFFALTQSEALRLLSSAKSRERRRKADTKKETQAVTDAGALRRS
jgi:hypothetical protein